MIIKCPECGFSRSVADDKLPARAEMATCPKCKNKFKFRTLGAGDGQPGVEGSSPQTERSAQSQPTGMSAQGRPGPEGKAGDIWHDLDRIGGSKGDKSEFQAGRAEAEGWSPPWERLDIHGFFPGFFKTIKEVMFSPRIFFSKMQTGGGLLRPLVFYLLLAELQAVAQFLLQMIGLTPMFPGDGMGAIGFGAMGAGAALMLILYPLFLTIFLFIGAGLSHLCLMLVRATTQGFEGTFRAITYGSAPMVLGVIPILGAIIGAIWALVTTFIGYMGVHRASAARVLLAMLLPLLAGVVLVGLGLVLQ